MAIQRTGSLGTSRSERSLGGKPASSIQRHGEIAEQRVDERHRYLDTRPWFDNRARPSPNASSTREVEVQETARAARIEERAQEDRREREPHVGRIERPTDRRLLAASQWCGGPRTGPHRQHLSGESADHHLDADVTAVLGLLVGWVEQDLEGAGVASEGPARRCGREIRMLPTGLLNRGLPGSDGSGLARADAETGRRRGLRGGGADSGTSESCCACAAPGSAVSSARASAATSGQRRRKLGREGRDILRSYRPPYDGA